MVFPTSRPHCRMDRVRGIREKFVDVAVGLVSWTIPILVPAGYSRYQAGTGQLFADPPLVNLMPLSLAVLAAATAARTAGRSRRAGMARSAGIVLGAGADNRHRPRCLRARRVRRMGTGQARLGRAWCVRPRSQAAVAAGVGTAPAGRGGNRPLPGCVRRPSLPRRCERDGRRLALVERRPRWCRTACMGRPASAPPSSSGRHRDHRGGGHRHRMRDGSFERDEP